VIEYGSVRYYVRVAELKPAPVVSLCGDVDLETDFMPPEVRLVAVRRQFGAVYKLTVLDCQGSDPKRPSTGKPSIPNDSSCIKCSTPETSPAVVGPASNKANVSPATAYGRRLRDGGYVESFPTGNAPSANAKTSYKCSLQKAQQLVRDKQSKPVSVDAIAATMDSRVLSAQLRLAQGAFTTPGHTLGKAVEPQPKCPAQPRLSSANPGSSTSAVDSVVRQDGATSKALTCETCLANLSSTNVELHSLRCAKNLAYHKVDNTYLPDSASNE
jgi:hypothetical protein